MLYKDIFKVFNHFEELPFHTNDQSPCALGHSIFLLYTHTFMTSHIYTKAGITSEGKHVFIFYIFLVLLPALRINS